MNKLKVVAVVLAALTMSACATGYEASDFSLTGGYSETRLAPDTWRVLVEGNGFTSRGQAEAFLMRRCAELTLEQGKRYFVLADHEAWMLIRRTSRDSFSKRPINEAVVTAVAQKNREAFDAVEIIRETDEIAKGRLSLRAQKTLASITGEAVASM